MKENPINGVTSNKAARQRLRAAPLFIILLIAALVATVFIIEMLRRGGSRSAAPAPTSEKSSNITSDLPPFPRQLLDGGGESLVIAAPPRRIVSQTLATDEILLAICSSDRIAGLSPFALDVQYSNIAEEPGAISKPNVKNAEQIIELKPDLIFVSSYSRAETVELLRATNAPVFRFANFDRLEDIVKNIRLVGHATGDDDRAGDLVREMESRIAAVKTRVAQTGKRPRVLSFSPSGNTAGAETLFDDVLQTIGAVNVAAERGLKGFPQISAEQVAAWQPDFIVTGSDRTKMDETRRRLLANPVIAASEAGRAGRIVIIDSRYFLTVSHHIATLIEKLADGLYVEQSGR